MSFWIAGLDKGMLVPGQQALGRVHSVFEHACNVALDGGRWLTLLDKTCAHAPQAVRLDLDGGLRGLFRPGEPFSVKAGAWRTGRCRGDIAGLPVWSPAPACALLPPGALRVNLGRVDAELAAWQAAHPVHRPAPDLQLLQDDLASATSRRDARGLAAAASRLLGRGQGLTPSGDDVLTGCLCGLWRLSGGEHALRTLLDVLCDTVAGSWQHTTDVGRLYLELASRDLFTEPLDELRRSCLERQDDAGLRAACRRALAVGGSSGFDGVTGLALACRGALGLGRSPSRTCETRGNTLEPAL